MYKPPEQKKQSSINERIVRAIQSGKIDEVLGDIVELSKTPKEISGVMGTPQQREGEDLFIQKMGQKAKALAGSMGDQSMENIQQFLEETKEITTGNARQFVMLSNVLLDIQVKNSANITDTSYQLKDIEDNPNMPPEVKAWARSVKGEVQSAIASKVFEEEDEIKSMRLRQELESGNLALVNIVPVREDASSEETTHEDN
ncbi:MAG: hypothetical protein ABIG39_07265 [Candidatus Micrarchaeota archaeon]